MSKKRLVLFISIFLLTVSAFALRSSRSHDRIKDHLMYLASDELEGRGIGTAGLDSAAAYIARVFQQMNVLPGGDGQTYFQKMGITITREVGIASKLYANGQRFDQNFSFVPLAFSEVGDASGELVFLGYGIIAPEYDYDDFEGIDVTNKMALILRHEPGEFDSTSLFNGIKPTAHSDLRNKAINAKLKGAAGVIFVHGPKYHPADEPLPRIAEGIRYQSVGIPVVHMTQKCVNEILSPGKLAALQKAIEEKGKPHSQLLKGVTVQLMVDLKIQQVEIKNVIGWLPGKEDEQKREPLIVGAHYDHLGYGGPNSRTPGIHEIHNGADDNASGVAALLELVTLFKEHGHSLSRPVIFVAFTAEEQGLIGSLYFVEHASESIQNAIAMINLDTIGRMVNNKLIIFGVGSASEWEQILNGINHAHGFDLTFQVTGLGPSDHTSFYNKEIPVLHFFTGANVDYHKPSDDADKINFTDLTRLTLFVKDLCAYLGDRESPLTYSAAGKMRTAMSDGDRQAHGSKRPWLGTIPDFAYNGGDGLRLAGVSPSSPCEKAGLKAGDLIVKMGEVPIKSIYEVTHVLRSHKPGDIIHIVFIRKGIQHSMTVTLEER